jgi:YidC/Oxa1 family membrane protein insertase
MDNVRLLLWAGLAYLLWLNYSAWQQDYARPPAAATTATAPTTAPRLDQSVPGAPAATAPAAAPAAPAATVAPPAMPAAAITTAEPSAPTVAVRTDVLDVVISARGGELIRADLLRYPEKKNDPSVLVRLLNEDKPDTRFVLQSGLSGTPGSNAPDHRALFSVAAERYSLESGSDLLTVPLTWTGDGITVTKLYTFRRGSYAIGVSYQIKNDGANVWRAVDYAQLLRHHQKVERSYFNPDTYAYRGPAWYNGSKYQKLDVEKPEDRALPVTPVTGGWAAALQHHFVAAIVPDATTPAVYSLDYAAGDYLLRTVGPVRSVAPGATERFQSTFYVGPKLESQLEAVSSSLDLTTDYGRLTVIARPLFGLLAFVHRFVHNWGFAIIIVTALIKLAFYPLAQTSGRSMARMRALAPRMKDIQERYKDNREELGRQMMELYKREKVNPLAGCLPIVVQIPVFIAFYWVLLESVEMRQAPWMLWVQDLSSKDPFFILPGIMAIAMWGQFKLNPPPPDPMQAKVFAMMPFVMAFTMAFFPAGLVLYWITNTGLSILQQWRINKVVEAEVKKTRK